MKFRDSETNEKILYGPLTFGRCIDVQCRHLIPALNEQAAQA